MMSVTEFQTYNHKIYYAGMTLTPLFTNLMLMNESIVVAILHVRQLSADIITSWIEIATYLTDGEYFNV